MSSSDDGKSAEVLVVDARDSVEEESSETRGPAFLVFLVNKVTRGKCIVIKMISAG